MTEVPEPAVEEEIRPEIVEELRQLEAVINKNTLDAIRARWESGRTMLQQRFGKRLPNGVLQRLAADLNVDPSELTARMKFATKYQSEDELADAVRKFPSWHAITHQALTTRRRTKEPVEEVVEPSDVESNGSNGSNGVNLRLAASLIDDIINNVDAGGIDPKDVARLLESVVRLKTAVKLLAAA